MDDIEFDSSSQDASNQGKNTPSEISRQTPSTDHQVGATKKSKNSKKKYEPIQDGDFTIRYQDDPIEYKRLRKKIQNRESAARIRGRKKGTMDSLEVQVDQLKKINSQLLLKNATLESQNKALKNEVQFLRSVVKPSNTENIQQYLNLDQKPPQQEFESPFKDEDSFNWVRNQTYRNPISNWSSLFIISMVVCVFVLPSSESDSSFIAQEIATESSNGFYQINLGMLISILRNLARILLGGIYLYCVFRFGYQRYWIQKKKKV